MRFLVLLQGNHQANSATTIATTGIITPIAICVFLLSPDPESDGDPELPLLSPPLEVFVGDAEDGVEEVVTSLEEGAVWPGLLLEV